MEHKVGTKICLKKEKKYIFRFYRDIRQQLIMLDRSYIPR